MPVFAALATFAALAAMVVLGQANAASSLSLEEAKEVTGSLEDSDFAPPPRSITDITAILDEQRTVVSEEVEKLRAEADAETPDSNDPKVLAKFYMKRGRAAFIYGRAGQALEDLQNAARSMKGVNLGKKNRIRILLWLSNAEWSYGNPKRAIKLARKANKIRKTDNGYRTLVKYLAGVGDIAGAEEAYNRAQSIFTEKKLRRNRNNDGSVEKKLAAMAAMEGEYFSSRGQFREAEIGFRKAIDIATRAGDDVAVAFVPNRKAQLATILRRQGRLVESEVVARDALLQILSAVGRNNRTTANVTHSLAKTLLGQGRYDEADKLLRVAIDILEKSGSGKASRSMGGFRRSLLNILVAKEDWAGALTILETARADMANNQKFFQKFFLRNEGVGIALLKAGRTEDALAMLSAAYEKFEKNLGKKHVKTAGMRALLAMAQAEAGDKQAALQGFREALPILLSRSRQAESDETAIQEQRRTMVLEAYIRLLAGLRGTSLESESGVDVVGEAFRMANVARGQTVQRALAASSARATAGNPELADIARREQDARKQIASLYALLADVLSKPTDHQDADAVHALRVRIDQLRGARAALMESIEDRFADYAGLINPQAMTVEATQATLDPGEALLSFLVAPDRIYAWAVPKSGAAVFATVDLGKNDLAAAVTQLRLALEPSVTALSDIPAFDVAAAYDLYAKLFEPVQSGWQDATSLLLVTDGPLGQLPLSLLPTRPVTLDPDQDGALLFANYRQVPWLARSHAITVLPSVASLQALRGGQVAQSERRPFVGFGDPFFSQVQADAAADLAASAVVAAAAEGSRGLPITLRSRPVTRGIDSAELARLPRLPSTRVEIESIAEALGADPAKDVYLGGNAGEGRVKALDLSGYKVISFATHGLVPGDLNGLVQPALALSSPAITGDREDGLLTMGEILSLKLNADWVVLSACNTASAEGKGAEAVSGLGRAFFYAGTRALLVSNWPVHSAATTALTTDLFRRQAANATLSRAEALRQTRLHLIDAAGFSDAQGNMMFSYAHPIFWAPFTVVGDGGGGG